LRFAILALLAWASSSKSNFFPVISSKEKRPTNSDKQAEINAVNKVNLANEKTFFFT